MLFSSAQNKLVVHFCGVILQEIEKSLKDLLAGIIK